MAYQARLGLVRYISGLRLIVECVLTCYKENAIMYHVDVPGAKYSHAIYTSILTGQVPTNWKGEPIVADHLIKSMVRSNYKLQYIGPEWYRGYSW
jgi:hypothetical protein